MNFENPKLKLKYVCVLILQKIWRQVRKLAQNLNTIIFKKLNENCF